VLLDYGTIRPETCRELEFCNIIVILIKMCAFTGLNCNKLIMVHKMENVKFVKSSNVHFEISKQNVCQFSPLKILLHRIDSGSYLNYT
jgi:hypothetical protein